MNNCCCCETRHETKIMLNSVKARPKASSLESSMQSQIILVFVIQVRDDIHFSEFDIKNTFCSWVSVFSAQFIPLFGPE